MTQPDANSPEETNPYAPPIDAEGPPAAERYLPYRLPLYHWPLTIGLSVALVYLNAVSMDGLGIPFAIATFMGGIRTAWVMSSCAKAGYIQPSYWGLTIVSPILVLVFEVVATVTFFIACAAVAIVTNTGNLGDQLSMGLSGGVGIMAFFALFVWSIGIAINSRRPIA